MFHFYLLGSCVALGFLLIPGPAFIELSKFSLESIFIVSNIDSLNLSKGLKTLELFIYLQKFFFGLFLQIPAS